MLNKRNVKLNILDSYILQKDIFRMFKFRG
jgi:hypothetical protein